MKSITITAADDWHVHFRDGEFLGETVPATARCFKRAIVMPNLQPPVTQAEQAIAYRQRILSVLAKDSDFQPLMTLYLTDQTTPQDIIQAKQLGITAIKLYPAGATTHSDAAVKDLTRLYAVFESMQQQAMPLLVHGEVTDAEIDIFDREKVFIDRHLTQITARFPNLKVVFEHITTKEAVDFVLQSSDKLAATVTPQHLLLNRNDLLVGGIRPHNYCLPVLKRNSHQQALRKAIASGSKKFFLGTDSAPHLKDQKESDCGCAGCYSAPSALELYAQIFEDLGALDQLEAFSSFNGADFYQLPRNTEKITLIKQSWQIAEKIQLPGNKSVIPFFAKQTVNWKIK